jgi:hypothetical protein
MDSGAFNHLSVPLWPFWACSVVGMVVGFLLCWTIH